jgi:signal peptidase II
MFTAMQKAAFLLFSLLMIAADQLSKWAVSEHVIRPAVEGAGAPMDLVSWYTQAPAPLPFASAEITSFFNLVIVWNKGISFGMFNHATDYGPMILVGISLVITLIFFFILLVKPVSAQSWGIALIIGGAIGNVIDRLRFSAVIDFIDVHIGDYHWPAFNIADSCVCVGVALLIILGLFFEKPREAAA